MQFVNSADGASIAYDESGAGPPLVLVHGTSAARSRWLAIRPSLEEHFTVVAMDRRGRGDSGDGSRYAIEREFEDVAAVVDVLDVPVLLFGHSYGGICALEAALLSDRISGLILYEPPIFEGKGSTPEQVTHLEALLAAGDREEVVATFMREVVRVPTRDLEKMRTLPAWPARVAAAHTLPRELRGEQAYRLSAERLAGLSLPALLLLGGASPPIFHEAIARLEKALPRARTAVMPDQGHVAMDTAPQLVVDAVLGFHRDIG